MLDTTAPARDLAGGPGAGPGPATRPAPPPPLGEAGLVPTLRALWPYLWPGDRPDLQRRVALSFALVLVVKLVTVGVPFTFKWATDALVLATGASSTGASSGWTPALLIGAPVAATFAYAGARVLMALLTQAREGLFARVAMHAVRRLSNEVFVHMHRLSLRFHLERKTGGLTRVLERGRRGIEELSRMAVMTLIPTIVEFALVLGVLWWQFDWHYAAIIAAMVAVYLLYTIKATEWRIGIRRAMNDSDTEANTKAVDSLLNYETVKYFGAEAREAARYDVSMVKYQAASVKTYTSLAVLNAGQAAIFTVGLALCMALSARDVMAGKGTVGDFVLVNALLIQLYQPLNFMGMVYREIKQAIIDIEAMFRVLATGAEVRDAPGAVPLAVREGTVRFEDVRFSYDPAREILKGVTFEVPAGRTVAIVGPSGAGKSTLSRLLFRFYDVTGGRVTIDGQDVRDVTQASLRAAVGMVPQDTVLFNDTLRYNIGYGRDGADQAAIEGAADLARIAPFVRQLPEGYAAQVGERGLKLSGGEKQRVAIARTILKGPPILILDEATSALDSVTEARIQDALDQVSRGRTTLVIAHRLTTVVNADQIIVLDEGVVAERGTHAELLAMGGTYAGLWNRQREADAAREALARAEAVRAASHRVSLAEANRGEADRGGVDHAGGAPALAPAS